jgi:hypothetical protein
MSDSKPKYILYHYDPSFAAAVAFIALFSLSTILHIWQLVRRRTWYFIPFVVGGLCKDFIPKNAPTSQLIIYAVESIGYIGRALNSKQTPDWSTGPYTMQSLLILLAPALFAASIYMVLARIIRLTDGEAHSLIKVKWLTSVFVLGDVLSFLAQSAGTYLVFPPSSWNSCE